MKMTRGEMRGGVALAAVLAILLTIIAVKQCRPARFGSLSPTPMEQATENRGKEGDQENKEIKEDKEIKEVKEDKEINEIKEIKKDKEIKGIKGEKKNKHKKRKGVRQKAATPDRLSPHDRPV